MNASSVLEQYRISDLLEWYEDKKLVINPDFQRRAVWTLDGKSYLIDTILRSLPIPKIYMRTKVDLRSQKSFREIVDGQQRLRAIFDFASNNLALNKRAAEFEGMKYDDLDSTQKETFLSYTIAVEQLINATDEDVLEVFSRLNSYTVSLNPPELRHAKYQTDFKWAVYNTTKRWDILWERYKILPIQQRVRMMDDSFMAEIFGIHLRGIIGGTQKNIDKLYEEHKKDFPEQKRVEGQVEKVINFISKNLDECIVGSIAKAPHFLMLYAALAHAIIGIPEETFEGEMPSRNKNVLKDIMTVRSNIAKLNEIIEEEEVEKEYFKFWDASRRGTNSIASRKIRFLKYFEALMPEAI